MTSILSSVKQELIANADEKTKQSGQRFFKEAVNLYGVKTATVTQIAKKYFQEIKTKDKHEVFALCDQLWQSGMMEESFIACNWSYAKHNEFTLDDFPIFTSWVNKYVSNWAACDTLCNHTIGSLVERNPELITELKKWAKSDNRWVKRASSVSLIIPAKKGLFLAEIFQIADILLLDPDDMVQKGYGWLLKEASRAHQQQVFEYVIKNKKNMPRTALRYAIEKMPTNLKQEAMKK